MSSRLTQSVTSTEFIRVAISATEAGATINPTSKPVSFAFPTEGTAVGSVSYTAGAWETSGSTYYARINVGPIGSVVLPVGLYEIWVKIEDGVERPARRTGLLEIF